MTDNPRKNFRFWDTFNQTMTYSKNAKSLAEFFDWYETAIAKGNNPIFMYSIGLTDINGKLIFEGDILRHPDGSKFEVIFELPDAQFRAKYEGNIYEDKNLLKDPTIS